MPGPAPLPIARAREDLCLLPGMANRHGLVAGATGTGKTVSLRVMAEALSGIGVPVFMADVKGDLSGLARPGGSDPRVAERARQLGLEGFAYAGAPVVFWDVLGKQGHPVRATASEMGPLLLGRILGLNEVQQGVLSIAFQAADDAGLLLLDLKDLRAMVQHVSENARALQQRYGNVSAASVGAIQRSLLTLEQQGGERLFGEPALDLEDLVQTDGQGKGVLNVLAADELVRAPRLYATFLLWMLSELFERLPEVGDPEKPRLVFFFDEAHLLFEDAPGVLLDKVQQVVRLIRSKGVGVYFVTQNPLDVPDAVLGQLGNRVQHALRAFTPRDQKAVKAAATTFRQSPGLDVEKAITELAVGEALVSFLDARGTPAPVERALLYPPRSRLGPLSAEERAEVLRASPVAGHYEQAVDRESAYEMLLRRAQAAPAAPAGRGQPAGAAQVATDMLSAMAKSAVRAAGTQIGRQIMRGVLGSIFGGRR
ncbi:MAG TPA: helicase HerA-like domain-containing protein [Anaeromyxobacteraceae bacterium]|nr:helicase HerA-like domain-containing protein [Anaeromyxobacteraceae bacterium]